MPTFTFRLPLTLSRKLRAVAKIYDSQPGPFLRDLVEATIEGGLRAQLFQQRLSQGMARYAEREVLLSGSDAGGFTAPGKPAEETTAPERAKREAKKP